MPDSWVAASKNVGATKTTFFPINGTQLRSFWSACSVYGRFINDFFRIALPFNHYLQKYKKLAWQDPTTESLDAFNTLNLIWWSLLYWPFCSCLDHTWSIPMQLHMHLKLFFFNSRTVAIWMSELQSDTGAERSIRRKVTTLQPNRTALQWYGLSSVTGPIHQKNVI